MSEEDLHPSSEELDGANSAPRPQTEWHEVEAKAAQSRAGEQQAQQAEDLDKQTDRQAAIELYLMDNDLFGFEPYSPEVLGDLTKLLHAEEQKYREAVPDFDIASNWSEKRILRFFERKYDQKLEKTESTENREKEKSAYEQVLSAIKQENPDIDNLTLCQKLLAQSDKLPKSEIPKLQAFVDMQSLATTPEDQLVVNAKINTLNFDGGIPDPVLFIQSSILTAPDLSEASKDAIAKHFKVPRFKTNTGSQVDKAMDAKNEAGEPLHDEHNPLPIRDGLAAYNKPDGTRVARVEVDGIGSREIPWARGEKGETIGLKLSMLKIYAINEAKGVTDFMGETVDIDTVISGQTDPEKLRKTSQIMEALLGGQAGYNGQIITDQQAEFLNWFSQYTSTKGDALEGDYDKHTAVESRTALGFHPNGHGSKLDYDVLRAAGSFAQGQYGSGAPDYFALQKHLHSLFPNRVLLTGENEEISVI